MPSSPPEMEPPLGPRSASALELSKPPWSPARGVPQGHHSHQSLPRLLEPELSEEQESDDESNEDLDRTIRRALPTAPLPQPLSNPEPERESVRASISAPVSASGYTSAKPTLLFAIASDDAEEVQKALQEEGPGSLDVNDAIGPNDQSAMAFMLMNDQLKNKLPILKVLLGHGANPDSYALSVQNADYATR